MSQVTSRPVTTSTTSLLPIHSRLSTSRLRSAIQLSRVSTQRSLRSPPKSLLLCGRANSTEMPTKGRIWTTQRRGKRRITSTQRLWRGYVRQSTTCTWLTFLNTRTPWTVAECLQTRNSRAAEDSQLQQHLLLANTWVDYGPSVFGPGHHIRVRGTENDNKRKWKKWDEGCRPPPA